jgi:hypothetical protein
MSQVWVLGCPDQAAPEQAANPTQATPATRYHLRRDAGWMSWRNSNLQVFLVSDLMA